MAAITYSPTRPASKGRFGSITNMPNNMIDITATSQGMFSGGVAR